MSYTRFGDEKPPPADQTLWIKTRRATKARLGRIRRVTESSSSGLRGIDRWDIPVLDTFIYCHPDDLWCLAEFKPAPPLPGKK